MTNIQIMADWIKDETQDWLEENGKHIHTDNRVFDSNIETWQIPTSMPTEIASDLTRCLFGEQSEAKVK